MNSDFKDLLRIFNENECKFMIVGGYAVMRYTEPRYTKNIDILVECSKENATKVYKALAIFGAPLHDLTIDDLATPGIFFQIGLPPNRIDVITSIPGIEFSDAFNSREYAEVDGIRIPFISRQDLIKAKLAAGRPQDLVDAGALAKNLNKK